MHTHSGSRLRTLPKAKYQPARSDTFCTTLVNTLASRLPADPSQVIPCRATVISECIASAAARVHGFHNDMPQWHRHQIWYDDEVKGIRRQLHALPRFCTEYVQVRKEYHRVKQRKRRQFQLECQQQRCKEACSNAAAFWRKYKKRDSVHGDINPDQWRSAFQVLFGPEIGPESSSEAQGPQGENPELNTPITHEEVAAAFRRLKRHKASGMDGIKAEYLIDAEDILIDPLTTTFNQMLVDDVPQSWCTGVIHPIFKSGDANDPSNYRGITVTSVLAKLFAMILEARMSVWAEDHDLRAAGQAGFCKDYRTTDNVFIMQTIIATAHKAKKKLYCCILWISRKHLTLCLGNDCGRSWHCWVSRGTS